MSKVRVIFLGTPNFAVTSLRALLDDDHYDVAGVVTQPDRPAGRKMQLQASPVKNYCYSRGIKVISPETVNSEVMLDEFRIWGAEVAIVVAFGQILSEEFIKLFPLGAVNIHGSLLPRWRGAAPIQRALEYGDQETGVTLQKIVKKLDAGDILGIRKIPITDEMDAQSLHDVMAELSGDLLHVELMDYMRGNLSGLPQDQALVTYAKKIEKSESQIDWNKSSKAIFNKVRAFVMGPGTWTTYNESKLKIHKVVVINETTKEKPGTIVLASGEEIWVSTGGGGIIKILELQPESRNRINSADFIKGYSLKVGEVLK
jgi:methionyl-tRNA formyltransferase